MAMLWYTRCPVPTPFGIAAQKDWLQQEFEADGLRVRALQDADDAQIRHSHFTHSQPWSPAPGRQHSRALGARKAATRA